MKKSIEQFTDQAKKSKKNIRESKISIKDKIKALTYKSCLSFPVCQKKIVELLNY